MMVSNCRVMPVQFRLTSAWFNSITPGVATDHQSPKRGEMQVRQNPLSPSLLAESSMGKKTECMQPSLKPAWPTWEARGHSQKRHRIERQATSKRPGRRLTETRRIVQPYRRRHMTLWNGTTRAGSHQRMSRCQPQACTEEDSSKSQGPRESLGIC